MCRPRARADASETLHLLSVDSVVGVRERVMRGIRQIDIVAVDGRILLQCAGELHYSKCEG